MQRIRKLQNIHRVCLCGEMTLDDVDVLVVHVPLFANSATAFI